jgi:hypothetical protein
LFPNSSFLFRKLTREATQHLFLALEDNNAPLIRRFDLNQRIGNNIQPPQWLSKATIPPPWVERLIGDAH